MFRFTVRELMLFTVIVGLALGWGVREIYWFRERQKALDEAAWSRAVAIILKAVAEESGWKVQLDSKGRDPDRRTLQAEKGGKGWYFEEDGIVQRYKSISPQTPEKTLQTPGKALRKPVMTEFWRE